MIDKRDLIPEDMSDYFFDFRIPIELYAKWASYSARNNITMKLALTNLLADVATTCDIPEYDTLRVY